MKLPNFSCEGRTALVTGAARGIGLAMARTLAAAGAGVAIHDVEPGLAAKEAAAINNAGGRAIGIDGDASDLSSVDALVGAVRSGLGEIDILINNASVQRQGKFTEVPLEEMQWQLNANVLFVTLLCQRVIPHMEAQRWGRIINLGSIQGRGGNGQMAVYAMSKAAMENLSRGLARSLAKSNITVNCVAPGWFNTLRNASDLTSPEVVIERGKRMPLGRLGEPEDCDGITLLLCSEAGNYITGQTIRVDGGMSA
ncbi:MAG TPA: SDR family oxidoreductase [Tepidisphaeraceae bacterium]|jgi:NAD(P)-dependent dehydrogenase (short-subunit alcohol dehydrogenase family)